MAGRPNSSTSRGASGGIVLSLVAEKEDSIGQLEQFLGFLFGLPAYLGFLYIDDG